MEKRWLIHIQSGLLWTYERDAAVWITSEIMWLLCSIFATQIQGCRINAWRNILGLWPLCFSGFGWIWNWGSRVTCETSYWFASHLCPAKIYQKQMWRHRRKKSFLVFGHGGAAEGSQIESCCGSCLLPFGCQQTTLVTFCSLAHNELEIHFSVSSVLRTCILQLLAWLEEYCELLQ